MNKAFKIEIKGLVQGVGFRPFIYRLAGKFGINGWVKNSNEGVEIKIPSVNAWVRISREDLLRSAFACRSQKDTRLLLTVVKIAHCQNGSYLT